MASLEWRDLACLPWFLWIAAVTTDIVLAMPPAAYGGEVVMPLLLLTIAISPAFVLVWLYRRAWLVRQGWWIPLGLIGIGIVKGVWAAGLS